MKVRNLPYPFLRGQPLNPEYKKLRSLGDFCYCTFGCTSKSAKSKVTSDSEGALMKLPRCVYSRNSVKSSFDTDTGFLFL